MRQLLLLLLILATHLVGIQQIAVARDLQAPLAGPLAVTSSFGEYRANRFHAGVDLSTQARIGEPVLAVAAGRVERVKVSSGGYGRALYLRLDDGRIAVYGHLDRFLPAVEEAVAARQLQARRYRVDWQWQDAPLRIPAGDVVGWSGQAGTSVPHLHFELRDGQNRPLDPAALGLALRDTVPPTLSDLRVVPRGPGSTIDGSPFARSIPLALVPAATNRSRHYRARSALRLSGAASLEVEVWDQDDARRGRLALAGATLRQDGQMRLELRVDSFSWSAAARSRHLYVGSTEEPGSRNRLRLDVPLDGRDEMLFAPDPAHPRGWLVAPGPAGGEVHLELRDRQGNRALVTLPLAPAPLTRPGPPGGLQVRAGPVDGLLALRIRAPGTGPTLPLVLPSIPILDSGPEWELVQALALGPGDWVAWVLPKGPGELRVLGEEGSWGRHFAFQPAPRGRALAIVEATTGARLEIARDGLYDDALVALSLVAEAWPPPDSLSGLGLAGPVVELGPRALYFRERPVLSLPLDPASAQGRTKIFRLDQDAQPPCWRHVGGEAAPEGVRAWIAQSGIYAPWVDDRPPMIGKPSIVGAGRVLQLPLADGGSGVDAESVELYLNGQWIIAGWDGPREQIEARLSAPLKAGPQQLRVVARDRAGNGVDRVLSFGG